MDNLCTFCGQEGHRASHCPRRPAMTACMGADFLRECFSADFDAGALTWRERPPSHFATKRAMAIFNSRFAGKPAGVARDGGYLAVWVMFAGRRNKLLVHRVLWCMRTGAWPSMTIDHVDMDRSNNRANNLREASFRQQAANRRPMRSGLKGASFDEGTGRFIAQITSHGKNHFLGRFATERSAHEAYCEAAKMLHGEFARES